jgi:hypothetical protein
MTDKKEASLRTFDKRESQRKLQKEKEEQEAAERYIEVSPKIVYDGNQVERLEIWLDYVDRNGIIYIGRFGDKMIGKKYDRTLVKGELRLHYSIGRDIDSVSSASSNGKLITEWTVHEMERIVVRHNKLNTGIIVEKIFGIEPGKADKVEQSMYIPMSRIYHIIADGQLRIPTDEIER